MREPRNLQDYAPVMQAIEGLEQIAKDLREKEEAAIASGESGRLMKWDLNIRMWDPKWADKPKRKGEAERTPASPETER